MVVDEHRQTPLLPKTISALLDKIDEVCAIPAAAQRVLALTSSDVDVRRISDALALDPGLAAQVLRVANSAAYARPRRVTDLHQAVTAIGLSEIRNMVAAMSILSTLPADEDVSHQLHESSVLAGTIARRFAKEFAPKSTELSLVCGLLCEVGALACIAIDGDGYAELWQTLCKDNDPWDDAAVALRDELEASRYGATTREIGAHLLERNMLPDEISRAIEAPSRHGDEPLPYGRITMFARRASCMLFSTLGVEDPPPMDEVLVAIAAAARLPNCDSARLHALCLEATVDTELSLRKLGPRYEWQPPHERTDA